MMTKTPSPLRCIAHRGARGYAPENTLLSIQKALDLGAKFIEIDVYNIEGHLVVFHDDRLERTTNGEGYLEEASYEYLRALDAGEGQLIPTLQEVCKLIKQQACLNIELKGANTADLVAQSINDYVKMGWQKHAFLVSSYNSRELAKMSHLDEDILIAALHMGLPIDDAKFAETLGAAFVHSSIEFIDQRFVDDAHNRGLGVNVYTVNHPDDIDKMQRLGVDGVFTDYPDRVLAFYDQGSDESVW